MKGYETNGDLLLEHQQKSHKIGMIFLMAHIPVFVAMAKYFQTQYSIALGLPLLLITAQWLANRFVQRKDVVYSMYAFTLIAFSGIMIHLGKGMIEWHFHIFVSIGLLCLLAEMKAIIAAAATAAVHHIAFFFYLPESVFNYEASFGIVVIHALFVVVESIACSYIAMKFKGNYQLQNKIAKEVGPIIHVLTNTSVENKSIAEIIAVASKNTSSSVEHIAQACTEISAMVESTNTSCEQACSYSEETKVSITDGTKTIQSINQGTKQIEHLKESLNQLQEDTKNIFENVVTSVSDVIEKTSLINDIVFQTKLLSFNASVEAARAGEHGKGFSVVAEEVGNLAASSGSTAEEISQLAESSQQLLKSSVDNIAHSFQDVLSTFNETTAMYVDNNEKLNHSFELIQNSSHKLDQVIQEISTSSQEQEKAVKSLEVEVHSVSDETSKVLNSSSEILSSADHMGEQTQSMEVIYQELNDSIDKKAA
jgi:methyl-accepting chemotaxis protein